MNDVYKALAAHLDTLPQRFPTNTGTGLELKVLQHIFSPEEAEMAIQLQPMPELPGDIAKRIAKDPEKTEALLLEMSKKGQMDAITVEDYSRVDLDRCIGCGLCVTTCDFDAIKLPKKDENHQWVPQPDYMTAVMDIYKERREG